jgi:hypothetical protein
LEAGIYLASTDEKTGIQALERKHETRPMIKGKPALREFEYIRHGTQALIASFVVATGKIIAPKIGPTRTEDDFAEHIEAVIASDPEAGWIFIVDQLNTHKSETLVRLVAQHCDIETELGEKGKSGILQSMPSRAAFLSDESHRIRFVYTPKHTSCDWRQLLFRSTTHVTFLVSHYLALSVAFHKRLVYNTLNESLL